MGFSSNFFKEATLVKVQCGVFFSEILRRPDLLSREVRDKFPQYFDGVFMDLPIPEGMDKITVSQAESKYGEWRLEVSRTRADIHFKCEEGRTYNDIKHENEKIKEMILNISSKCREESLYTTVSRVTNISEFMIEVDNPEVYLQDLFLKNRKQDLCDISIQYNQKIKENEIVYNNIFHLQSVDIDKNRFSKKRGIQIIRDFNSDVQKKSFTNEEIKDFFELAKKYSHKLTF